MSEIKPEKFIIEGMAGKRSLEGRLSVGGAKNAVLKALAASILFKDEIKLSKVPKIEDVDRILEILKTFNLDIESTEDKVSIDCRNIKLFAVPDSAKMLRASIVLTGPLLARFGEVSFPYPGGCVIGKRPIDFFISGFRAMGAEITEETGRFIVKAPNGKLHGAEIFSKSQSVTATETFMMAGVLAEGRTILKNAALEPEIVDLGNFLNKCGAKITGLGTTTIEIEGGDLLSGSNRVYETMPDRIEAGSFIILGALAGKDVLIDNCEPKHLDSLLHILKEAGVNFEIGKNSVRVFNNDNKTFKAVDVKTHEYPGFPTDLQAPLSIFLTQAEGQSFIFEAIFENRLNYLESVERFGAKARIIDSHRAIIDGPTQLSGKEVESPDLRAGLAFVLAGIIAEGETVVHNVYYIDRGYENIEERLEKLGVKIRRVSKN